MTNSLIATPDSPLVHRLFPSPNIEPRLQNLKPKLLVLHYTGLETFERSLEVLSRPDCKVSCHYVVDVDGHIVQMVSEEMRAWHAGVSCWRGETDINSLSIGIEIQNPGHSLGYKDFPHEQMRAVRSLCHEIMTRHAIHSYNILAHSDVAPARKIDPGEKFDWESLASQGLGLWTSPVSLDMKTFPDGTKFFDAEYISEARILLSRIGYCVKSSGPLDEELSYVLRAFQLHFRQELVNSRLDLSTLLTLRKLSQVVAKSPLS